MTAGDGTAVDGSAEHEALLSFLYQAPVGLVQCCREGHIALLNPLAAQLLLPLTQDPALANLYAVLGDLLPDLRQRVAGFSARHGRVCDGLRLAVRPLPAADGARAGGGGGARAAQRPAWLALTLLKLDADRLMAVFDDVSEQVQREQLLHGTRQWLGAVLGGTNDHAQVRLDAAGRVLAWNDGIGRVTGLAAGEVVGRPYTVFGAGDDAGGGVGDDGSEDGSEQAVAHLADADRDGWSLHDGSLCRADGSRFWGTVLIAPMLEREGAAGAGYHLILRDNDHPHAAVEQQLRTLHSDQLTGVANRQAFFEAAAGAVARCQRSRRPLALLLFGADGVKAAVARCGQPAGDAMLRHLAQCLQQAFRGHDLVGRTGGEVFAVLLPGTGAAAAKAAAERLCKAVAAQPVALPGPPQRTLRQNVSAGVALLEAGDGLDTLLQRAGRALDAVRAAAGRSGARACAEEPA